ncbi:interleukin-22 receptor subunit alpha-1 [Lissotriton helveticus]
MWALIPFAILFSAGVPVYAACSNFTDYSITLHSKNFECIWKWEEGNRLPPGTLYDVQYKLYGVKNWINKYECQNIPERVCNLTTEMAIATGGFNYDEYVVRVKARFKNCSSNWVVSKRVHLKEYTTIGPPLLTYVSEINSIQFMLRSPHIFIQSADGHPQTIDDIFKEHPVKYHLTLSSQKKNQTLTIAQKEFNVYNLEPATDYIATVYMIFESRQNSESGTFLVRTLPGNSWVFILGGILALIVLFAIAVVWLSYKYVNLPRKTPMSLDLRHVSVFKEINTKTDLNITSYIHGFSRAEKVFPPLLTSDIKLCQTKHSHQFPIEVPQDHQYKSQRTNSTMHTNSQSSDQTSMSPVSYLSQETQSSLSESNSKNSSMTYGLCAEEVSPVWKNNQQTTPLPQSNISWDDILQLKPKTESPLNCSSPSMSGLCIRLQENTCGLQKGNCDVDLPCGNDQQFQLGSSLFPLSMEENSVHSGVGMGSYRPQATISLSLLSSVRVNSLYSDNELCEEQVFHHSSQTDFLGGDHTTAHALLDTLSLEQPTQRQYKANGIGGQMN